MEEAVAGARSCVLSLRSQSWHPPSSGSARDPLEDDYPEGRQQHRVAGDARASAGGQLTAVLGVGADVGVAARRGRGGVDVRGGVGSAAARVEDLDERRMRRARERGTNRAGWAGEAGAFVRGIGLVHRALFPVARPLSKLLRSVVTIICWAGPRGFSPILIQMKSGYLKLP